MNQGVKRKTFTSLPAVGFILASLLLGCVLAFVTWHNIDREKQMMESFLLEEAQTLIRALVSLGQRAAPPYWGRPTRIDG